jgi:hypothetical protein
MLYVVLGANEHTNAGRQKMQDAAAVKFAFQGLLSKKE